MNKTGTFNLMLRFAIIGLLAGLAIAFMPTSHTRNMPSPLIDARIIEIDIGECVTKATLATEMLQSRESGETFHENLEALVDSYQDHSKQGIAIAHHKHVEQQRMLRDIFRKNKDGTYMRLWDYDELYERELKICKELGF